MNDIEKAYHLKIGNWVSIEGELIRLTGIDLDLDDEGWPVFSTSKHYSTAIRWLKNFDLVPITKEWMEEIGSEYVDWLGEYNLDGIYFQFDPVKYNFYFTSGSRFQIKYRSQVQNIYNALTGKDI